MSKLHCVGSLPDEKSCPDCRKESTRFSSLNIKLECDAHRRQRVAQEIDRDERLLKAAPEMLEVLKKLLPTYEPNPPHPAQGTYLMIEAAISKAEGKL